MMFAPKSGANDGVRRFLADLRGADRRSWHERRIRERRNGSQEVEPDRRRGERRSGTDRRIVLTDRRRRVHEAFSRGDAEQIREMMMDPGVEAACPQCDGSLMLGPVVDHEGGSARNVHCTQCRRAVLLVAAPGKPLELA
jgi:hypothetical protein